MKPQSLKQRAWRKRVYLSGPTSLDASVVRGHLEELVASGVSLKEIAARAGVNRETIERLYRGLNKRIYRSTYDAVMAVEPVPTWPQALVDATPTHRRLQALAWLGYPWKDIAEERGKGDGRIISRLLQQDTVTKRVHDEIAAVYERLSGEPCEARDYLHQRDVTKQRNRARTEGWVPPLAWDDIDNPDEEPKHDLTYYQRRRIDKAIKRFAREHAA